MFRHVACANPNPRHDEPVLLLALIHAKLSRMTLDVQSLKLSCYYVYDTVAGFLLLFIYAMINMNVVSWGTREVPRAVDPDGATAVQAKKESAWSSFVQEV